LIIATRNNSRVSGYDGKNCAAFTILAHRRCQRPLLIPEIPYPKTAVASKNVSRFARLPILIGKVQSHERQRQPRIQAIRRLAS
jgi:hypothetical protein